VTRSMKGMVWARESWFMAPCDDCGDDIVDF
jgi:hypothetical protein